MAMTLAERNARRRELYAARRDNRKQTGVNRSERSLRRDRAATRNPEAAQLARQRENRRKTLTRKMNQLKINSPVARANIYDMPYADAHAHLDLLKEFKRRSKAGERGIAPPDWDPTRPENWYHENADGSIG